MPPIPNTLSRMHAATHEPRTVTCTMSLSLTWYSPGSSFTASMLSWRSKYSLRATSASALAMGVPEGRRYVVDGLALEADEIRGVVEAFGMPGEEEALFAQQRGELLQDPVLRRLVEVDHHVAAEDGIERPAHRPGGVQQVELPEGDERHQLGPHL